MERSPEKDDYQDFDEVFEPHELPVPANPDYGPFLKGVIVGFGLAAVANLFSTFSESRGGGDGREGRGWIGVGTEIWSGAFPIL